jgi:hypothetical protein
LYLAANGTTVDEVTVKKKLEKLSRAFLDLRDEAIDEMKMLDNSIFKQTIEEHNIPWQTYKNRGFHEEWLNMGGM